MENEKIEYFKSSKNVNYEEKCSAPRLAGDWLSLDGLTRIESSSFSILF
jgi:hypothetical protein